MFISHALGISKLALHLEIFSLKQINVNDENKEQLQATSKLLDCSTWIQS